MLFSFFLVVTQILEENFCVLKARFSKSFTLYNKLISVQVFPNCCQKELKFNCDVSCSWRQHFRSVADTLLQCITRTLMQCFHFKSTRQIIEITLELTPSIHIKHITEKEKGTAKGRQTKQFSVMPSISFIFVVALLPPGLWGECLGCSLTHLSASAAVPRQQFTASCH